MRDSVPSTRYSPVCNVLRQWKTATYRVYRLYVMLFHTCRPTMLSTAVHRFLIPLLKKLTGSESASTSCSASSLSPSLPPLRPTAETGVTSSNSCREQSGRKGGREVGRMEVCDTLPSSQLYQEYVQRKVCIYTANPHTHVHIQYMYVQFVHFSFSYFKIF